MSLPSFAEVDCGLPDNTDHRRKSYITSQLNYHFQAQFGMSDEVARAAVAEEMKRRYSPNPWDAPGPRRPRPQRRTTVAKKEKVEEVKKEEVEEDKEEEAEKETVEESTSEEPRKTEGYSEEQWDLFERQFG